MSKKQKKTRVILLTAGEVPSDSGLINSQVEKLYKKLNKENNAYLFEKIYLFPLRFYLKKLLKQGFFKLY